MLQKRIVGNPGKIIVLEIVGKQSDGFPDVLCNDVPDDKVGLAGTGRADLAVPLGSL